MAITTQRTISSTDGIKKTIDEQSVPMVMDILQRGLYSNQVGSTIRELSSNAYDSIKERNVARDILLGTTKVENHYDTSLKDGIYHSSGWTPEYYDLKWLSDDNNITIFYEEGKIEDTLRIVDKGVGLGGYRLRKFFDLNWSSKRANKDTLGRLGLGSKVALSLADSFRLYSYYKGMKFGFEIYLEKFESIIPKFCGTGPNPSFELDEDYKVYYEPTDILNGVEIVVPIKKFNKKKLFQEVQEQLMYLPNVLFLYKGRGEITYEEVTVKAQVQYRDNDIVISKSTVLNTPHILLGTGDALINYGQVNFTELELEPKQGSVGLILDINDVEVTPSREGLVWSAKTRAAVVNTYEKATSTACAMVNKTLSTETDYLKWLINADNVLNSIRNTANISNKSVIGELASIINIGDIKDVYFSLDATIKFDGDLNTVLGDFVTAKRVRYDYSSKKVMREKCSTIGTLNKPIFITTNGSEKGIDLTIIGGQFKEFIILKVKEGHEADIKAAFILKSNAYTDYDAIVADQDIMDTFLVNETPDATDDDGVIIPVIDAAKQRRLNKEIVMHSYNEYNNVFKSGTTRISEVNGQYDGCDKIIYGSFNDRTDVMKVIKMFDPKNLLSYNTYSRKELNKEIGFVHAILLAKNNMKHLISSPRYVSLPEFIIEDYDSTKNKLIFTPQIRQVMTMPFIKHIIKKLYVNNEYVFSTYVAGWVQALDPVLYMYANEIQDFGGKSTIEPFYQACGMLQLMNAGLIPFTPEDRIDCIETIEDTLPDYLCDDVDAISDVQVIDLDLYTKFVTKFMEYEKIYGLMYQFRGNTYLNDKYSVEKTTELLGKVKDLL